MEIAPWRSFIASRSDIDDMVPILTAYQIEWNKLHTLLQGEVTKLFLSQNQDRTAALTDAEAELLATALSMTTGRTQTTGNCLAVGVSFIHSKQLRKSRKSIGLRLLASSLADYRRATAYWWSELYEQATQMGVDPEQRPIYFVSSNTHSLPNLLTGFACRMETDLDCVCRGAGARSTPGRIPVDSSAMDSRVIAITSCTMC